MVAGSMLTAMLPALFAVRARLMTRAVAVSSARMMPAATGRPVLATVTVLPALGMTLALLATMLVIAISATASAPSALLLAARRLLLARSLRGTSTMPLVAASTFATAFGTLRLGTDTITMAPFLATSTAAAATFTASTATSLTASTAASAATTVTPTGARTAITAATVAAEARATIRGHRLELFHQIGFFEETGFDFVFKILFDPRKRVDVTFAHQ